ncbi:mechanosensitive ion channel family protein [Photobacterium angustum]|nr:mechanosensitive ion channel family protein [Photobacterium angustum]
MNSRITQWLLQTLSINEIMANYLSALIVFLTICCVSFILNFILKRYIVTTAEKIIAKTNNKLLTIIINLNVIKVLSHLGPGIVFLKAAPFISSEKLPLVDLVKTIEVLAALYLLFVVIIFLFRCLDGLKKLPRSVKSLEKQPMHVYVQVLKIIIAVFASILAISIIINKSLLSLMAGIGALGGIALIVFKDSIMGLVSSIQVSQMDMVRVGDWITIPSQGVDGDVIELNLNTVKIRNFDKTIATIPTTSLTTSTVQNWRGMSESGGRRIKRALYINLDTVKFCSERLLEKLKEIEDLKKIIDDNLSQASSDHNGFKYTTLTNIGLFRKYIEVYLRSRHDIKLDFTFLVRSLEPTSEGLPIEIYIFTNDTNWINYEYIQSEIFDHILSSLPIFELKSFQHISGYIDNSDASILYNH